MDIVSIPIIAVICFILVTLLKIPFKANSKFLNFIPLIVGVIGGVLGIIVFLIFPEIRMNENVFHAFIAGVLSGLSTSGASDLASSISKYKDIIKK